MSTLIFVWTCTVLALVVVVLTRVRLHDRPAGGQRPVNRLTLAAHSGVGLLAVLLWVVFILAPDDSWAGGALFGIVAIGAWWLTAAFGLALLSRWRPARGRHSGDSADEAPIGAFALSVAGHVGLLLVVVWFTWLYLVSAV